MVVGMADNVVLIDDDPGILEWLETLFKMSGYETMAFSSGVEFFDSIDRIPASCIVTDLSMPRMDGLMLVKRLRQDLQLDWPIIMISAHGDVPQAVEALKLGAQDFLVKPFPPARLLTLVAHCLAGMRRPQVAGLAENERRYGTLTKREKQVAELLIAGASSKIAGPALGISPRTVDVFRSKILRKMGVSNIAAVASAVASLPARLRPCF